MSLPAPYQEHYYVADGVTTSFSFGEYFTAPASANVKCIVYFEDGTSSVPAFTVDIVTGYINITALTTPDGQVLNAPPAGSSVRVFRDTPEQQNVTASQIQNYTAKQLEKIFDSIVAMIQEVSYSDKHKTLRLTETQRDVFLSFLKEANDDALLYWDNEARTIVPTDFVHQDVVRMAGGLFFRAKNDSQLRPYLEWSRNGQTDWNSLNLWSPLDTANEAKDIAEEAKEIAQNAKDVADDAKEIAEDAKETAEGIEDIAEEARDIANDAKDTADDAKEIAEDAAETVGTFDSRLIQAEQDASDAKTAAQGAVSAVGNKVDKTTVANKVYGTDADGNQTTYDKGGFGQVDDVQVNNVSVVTNKVAKIDLTPYAKSADLATVATSGSYNDLSNKPTIPTVGNGTITFTQGGTTMGSFTTNQSGDETIALDSGGYHPDLFDVKWADHICNDVQWLRADTFSWQSGAVYQVAYQHLADDITGKTLQSKTISGTTVQFYLADDGHKICPASEESNVIAIYNATGVAWYYILDTVNQRFKLPRTKFGFTGIRSSVGGFVKAALPNIKGDIVLGDNSTPLGIGVESGPFYNKGNGWRWSASSYWGADGPRPAFDASRSSSIYTDGATVQPKATEMYLYFYVGNFTQTALENTAGVVTEVLNTKVTVGHEVIEFQAPTAANNYTWYRKYRDGWVEQGGRSTGQDRTITLPITMSNANYTIITDIVGALSWNGYSHAVQNITTTGFRCWYDGDQTDPSNWSWYVSGIAAN